MLILTEKLKLEIMFVDHIFVRVVGLVVGFELLRLPRKLLILSKSLNKRKLDSLAYSCGMRVFAYITGGLLIWLKLLYLVTDNVIFNCM
jgi:hypothetical protein